MSRISFIKPDAAKKGEFQMLLVKLRRRTPLQADGASKAPPHESGTR